MAIMRALQGAGHVDRLHHPQAARGAGDRRPDHRDPPRQGRRHRRRPRASEAELAALMVGRAVELTVDKDAAAARRPPCSRSRTSPSSTRAACRSSTTSRFEVRAGEILGIAGVQGNGQTELIEALLGLQARRRRDHARRQGHHASTVRARASTPGVGYIPEDRCTTARRRVHRRREPRPRPLPQRAPFAPRPGPAARTRSRRTPRERIEEFDIRTESIDSAGQLAVRRQPAEGRRRPRALPAAEGPDRRASRPAASTSARSSSSTSGSSPSATAARAVRDRVDRARRGRRARRPDRGDVPRPDRRHRAARHRPRGARPDDGRRPRPGRGSRGDRMSTEPETQATPEPERGAAARRSRRRRRPAARSRRPTGCPSVKTTLAAIVLALLDRRRADRVLRRQARASRRCRTSSPTRGTSSPRRGRRDRRRRTGRCSPARWAPATRSLTETLVRSAPLICAGLGVGAGLPGRPVQHRRPGPADHRRDLAAGYVGFTWDLPPGLHLLVALVAGLLGGALWGGIAGVLKARTGAHEVIATIMLNYVAAGLLIYCARQGRLPAAGQRQHAVPAGRRLGDLPRPSATPAPRLDPRVPGRRCLVWWILNRSTLGFELRAVGANPDAARTAGMNVPAVYTTAMLIAGAPGRPGRRPGHPRATTTR